jgi:type I restriction enzyme S subunit
MKSNNNNLPKGWRKVKLGEYIDIIRGISYSSSDLKKSNRSIYLVNLKNVERGGGFRIDGLKEYSGHYKNEQLVYCGDIIIALTDLTPNAEIVGMPALIPFLEKPACISMDLVKIQIKKDSLEKRYLYYLLNTKKYKGWIRGFASGVNVLHLNTDGILEFETYIPEDINEQKRIADILSAFDDKIELNNKIIKTFEEMAQEIFKEWFVRFRFPGWQKVKFVDSELGKIPEGWEVKNIMEIIKRLPVGKRYDNKTALPTGKVPILDQGQSGIIGFHNEEPSVKASPKSPVAVFSNHTCYYRLVTFDFSCIQNVIPYIGTNGYPTTFVFYLTKDKIKMSDYKGHWPEFANQKFVIPPQKLAIEYSEKIQPIIEKVDEIRKENQTLAELRDLLLPKLMSGEIRV